MTNGPNQDAQKTMSAFNTALLVLTPFGLGYFFSYLYRAVNAVVSPDLVAEFDLSASDLGLMTAAYLFAFAVFQLPLGILLDRYGPRRIQFVLLLIAALAAALFAQSDNVTSLTLSRALIGLGVAGGLMAGFKAVVMWVQPERRALANSFVMSMGAIGLLVSTRPTEWAVGLYGWRSVFLLLAATTVAVALIILIVVPERKGNQPTDTLRQSIAAVGQIYANKEFWLLAPLLFFTAGAHIAIQTLWAAPWLRDIAGLDREGIANMLFWMAAAFFVGIVAAGSIADWLGRRGIHNLDVMVGFIVAFILAQFIIVFDIVELRTPAWLVFGMAGQSAILGYPWLSSHFGAHLAGRSNTAINLLVFMMAFVIQFVIGWVIDLFPPPAEGGYGREAYATSFGIFLAIQVLALLLYLSVRRRHFVRPRSKASASAG